MGWRVQPVGRLNDTRPERFWLQGETDYGIVFDVGMTNGEVMPFAFTAGANLHRSRFVDMTQMGPNEFTHTLNAYNARSGNALEVGVPVPPRQPKRQ